METMNTNETPAELNTSGAYFAFEVVSAAAAIASATAATPAQVTGELITTLEALYFAPTFTVKRISPEAAEAFRALPQFVESGSRFLMLGSAQIAINVKLNGQAVLARIN